MKGEGGGQNSVHVVVECPLASLTITTLSDLKYLICLQDSERGWHKIKYERMQYLCQLLIIEVLVGLWSFGILFWHTIKKCSSDWEKLLKFKAIDQEFAKILKSLKAICSNSERSEKILVKLIFSDKTTKFCEIFTVLFSYAVPVKSKVKILKNSSTLSFIFSTYFHKEHTMLYVIAHLKLYNSVDVITHLKSIPLSHTIKISCIHDIQHGQAYRQHKL